MNRPRLENELCIKSFGRSHIVDGLNTLNRVRGLAALTDDAVDLLREILEDNQAVHDRMAADSRALHAVRPAPLPDSVEA